MVDTALGDSLIQLPKTGNSVNYSFISFYPKGAHGAHYGIIIKSTILDNIPSTTF
jgi:hypothetical protein